MSGTMKRKDARTQSRSKTLFDLCVIVYLRLCVVKAAPNLAPETWRLTPLLLVLTLLPSFQVRGAQASYNQSEEPQPGHIIERVVCKNSPDQTYALYLPSNYSPARTWPLVAAFDPGARGHVPVENFKDAAERYGYIVCGSNNSRNGPMAPTAESAKAMLGDVAARFTIDDKRIYLAGLSGGARAATTLAIWLAGQVTGVIGCGAGLAQGLEPSSLSFIYYGTVGDEDFNYPEMKHLDRSLESAGITHRIEVFEGAHAWAPPAVCVHAIEWLELQAMKSGRRSRDDSFIDRLFKGAQQSAAENESAGRAYEAWNGYAAIAADFKGLRDVAEFEKRSILLRDSKAARQSLSKERDQENQQDRMVSELFNLWARLRNPATSAALNGVGGSQQSTGSGDADAGQTSFFELKGKLADLKRKSEAKQRSAERALASRVLNSFLIATFEESRTLIQTKKYDLAISNLAIGSQLMPDNPRLLYSLVCAYALKGDKRHSIETLKRAVEKGFTNLAELERNSQLDTIREEPGFRKIVEELKQKR